MDLGVIVGVVMGVVALVVVTRLFKAGDDKKLERFTGRVSRSSDDLHAEFFVASGIELESFRERWKRLSTQLDLPEDKLLPTDRFDVELAPVKGFDFDDPVPAFLEALRNRLKKAGREDEFQNVKTIQDYLLAEAKL